MPDNANAAAAEASADHLSSSSRKRKVHLAQRAIIESVTQKEGNRGAMCELKNRRRRRQKTRWAPEEQEEANRRVQCSGKSVAREGKSRVSSLLWPFEIVITHYNSSTSASQVSVCSSAKVTVVRIQFQQKQNQQHLLKGNGASEELPASLLKKEMESTTNEPKRNELFEKVLRLTRQLTTQATHTQNCSTGQRWAKWKPKWTPINMIVMKPACLLLPLFLRLQKK